MEKTVSDHITKNDIKQWKLGDVITISAPTGSGKSYFVKNVLYEYARLNGKKILFLIHRANCVEQFQIEIEMDKKEDVIDIKTYQSLEFNKNQRKATFDFSPYQYIICDEFHYFLGDASFNKTTDISLNLILAQSDKIRIFMSATGEDMKRYLNGVKSLSTMDYELDIKFDHVKQLRFFNKDETLEEYVKEAIEKNQKCIFFIEKAQKAFELYMKHKDHCIFNCSKSNKDFYRYVDNVKINKMLREQKFQELILITTTALDSGVNIIDTELNNIIIDVQDVGSLLQCLGRKRIQSEEDSIYLYIKTINNRQLGGMKAQLKRNVEMADYLRATNVKKYVEKYGREIDRKQIVYDDTVLEDNKSTKKINELMYFKCKFDLGNIDIMLKMYKDFGYCKYLAKILKFYDSDTDTYYYTIEDENREKEELCDYFEKLKNNIMFQVNDRKELIEKINVKSNGKLLKKIDTLNAALKEKAIPYRIFEFSTSKMIEGKQKRFPNAWRIEDLE